MDFMFEDEVDEVGSDVEAYCPKCKGDTTHVVISKYEDEIRRVQCNPCGDVHSFRKPRGDVEDDVPEPIAAKKRAMMKKLTWEEFFAKHDNKEAKPYEFREPYRENHIVFHVAAGLAERVDIAARIALNTANLVFVLRNHDVRGIALALGAICLDVGADLVDLVFEHEVHSRRPFRVRLLTQVPGTCKNDGAISPCSG